MSISLFWAPSGLNKLPEVYFKFPFICGWQSFPFLVSDKLGGGI